MGIVQKDALRTSIVSYLGLILGYLNKGVLFLIFLTHEEIGLINLLASVATMYAQFASLGTFSSIWRFFPLLENKGKNHHGILTFNLLISLAGAAIVSLLALLFLDDIRAYYSLKSPLFANYLLWVIPVGLAVLIFLLMDSYCRAIQKSVFPTFANDVVLRLCTTTAIFIYSFDVWTFNTFLIVVCLLQWVPALLVALYLKVMGEFSVAVKKMAIPPRLRSIMLNYSAFSYLNGIGTSVIVTIDALMVAGMIGMAETGIYTTVIFISRALIIPYGSIMRVSVPLIPKFWKERNISGMQDLYRKVSSVSLVIGLVLFSYVWVSREELIAMLKPEAREAFRAGIYVFLFIMIGRLVDMYCGLNGTILITSKKYRYDFIFTSLLVVLVIVLNLQFIPRWGMVGAAISTALAYLLFNMARVIFVYMKYKIHPFQLNQLKVIVLAALVFTGFEFLPDLGLTPLFAIMVKGILLTTLFPGVIYILRIEPEINGYIQKLLRLKTSKTAK